MAKLIGNLIYICFIFIGQQVYFTTWKIVYGTSEASMNRFLIVFLENTVKMIYLYMEMTLIIYMLVWYFAF